MIEDEEISEFIKVYHSLMRFQFKKTNRMYGESATIHVLNRFPGLTPGELSEKIVVGSGRIANILNSLEEKKMIVRKIDLTDKRKTRVYLTEIGKNKVEENRKQLFDETKNMFNKLNDNDSKEFIRIMKIILENKMEEEKNV